MITFLRLIPVVIFNLAILFSANGLPISSKLHSEASFVLDIPLTISVKDKKSGTKLKPTVKIVSTTTGKQLKLKDTEEQLVVVVTKGDIYKINVELEGYKSIERTIDTKIYEDDGGNLVLDMEPLPSANVVLKAVDENGEVVEAMFKVSTTDKVYSGRTTKENPTYKVILTKSDLYQIEVIASTFQIKKDNIYAEVADPSRQYPKTITLEKPGSKLQLMVFADDTEQMIKDVKMTVKTDTETLIDKALPDGQISIESVFGKNYSITVEYPGYTKQSFSYKGSLQKEYKIIMQSETLVSVGAFDKLSGKRIPALFKITDSNNQTQELQGKADADIKFKPAGKSSYQIEITAKNYKPSKENLVIENLSAGKLNQKFYLESMVDDYIILVRDTDDKQMIQKPSVKVFDEEGKEIEIKTNARTGEMLVQLDKLKDYKIQVEAAEYQAKTESLLRSTNKLIGVNLKKISQLLQFTAIDAVSKQPVLTQYKVNKPENQEPVSGVSDANRQFRFEVLPKKSYTIEVSSEGYNQLKENISYDETKTESTLSRVFELQKGAYPFNFKVIDAVSKKEVQNHKLQIRNIGTSQPVSLQSNKNVYSGNLAFGSTYSIEAEADGYEKTTVTINSKEIAATGKFDYEVTLSKNPFEKYKLLVVEEGNNNKVPNANLRIFNGANEPIVVNVNATMTEWQAELRNDESYNVEVKAEGYIAYRNTLFKNPNDKTITVKIKKVPKHEITFAVVDAISKKPILSEFRITSNGTIVNGTVLANGTRYKVTITEDRNYEIEVNAQNYAIYKDGIRYIEAVDGIKTIEMKREFYPFVFKIVDSKSKKPVSNPKLTLNESITNEASSTKFSLESNEFQSNLKPEKIYILLVEAAGFENFTENLNISDLINENNFNKIINMTAIKKEEKPKEKVVEKTPDTARPIEVKVTDNPKTEPVAKVEPEKKIEPPKKEIIKPTPPPKKEPEKKGVLVEAPIEITDEDFNVKVELFEKKVIGRRFRLSNLYFEQSSPIIQAKSLAQLDKLVNTIKLNPKLIIEITGHTDNVGDPRQNSFLSEQRARVVANYLFNKGILNERIKYAGKGQDEPIAVNDTDDNRAKNRRVEFVLRDNIEEKQ